jgi:hypothetical protein
MLAPTLLVAAALVVTLAAPAPSAREAATPEVHGVEQLVALDTETGPLLTVRN